MLARLAKIKIPLRLMLISPFVVVVTGAVVLVWAIAFINGQAAVYDLSRQLRAEISARVANHLIGFLNTPLQISHSTATAIHQGWLNPQDVGGMQAYAMEHVHSHPTITSVYFGNAAGGLVGGGRQGAGGSYYVYQTEGLQAGLFSQHAAQLDANSDLRIGELLRSVPDMDARTRPWYRRAAAEQTSDWNDVYILFTGQDMALSASSPVFDAQHNLIGVASVDVFLGQLGDFLQSLHVSKAGNIFIIDREGLLVAASTGEPLVAEDSVDGQPALGRIAAQDSATPSIRYAADFLRKRYGEQYQMAAEVQLEFTMQDERYLLHVTPIQMASGIDWLSVVVIPESDVVAGIVVANRLAFLVSAAALGISMLLGIFLSRKIAGRISDLNGAVRAFARGQGEVGGVGSSRIAEIDELSEAFLDMQRQLSRTLDDLKAEIEHNNRITQALRDTHHQLQATLGAFPDLLFDIDASGKIYDFRTAHIEHLYVPPSEFLGHSMYAVLPAHASKVIAESVAEAAERGHSMGGRYWLEMPDGLCWYELAVSAKDFPTQADGRFIMVVRDITTRKQAEDEILRLNMELEQRVRQRTAQLESANKELEAFSYSVSHDLRAPLRGIDGWSYALSEDYGDRLDEQGREYIQRVRAEAQRMGKLIEDMLRLSRVTRADMAHETVDLSALAADIARRLQAAEPQRSVVFDIQPGLTALGDIHLLDAMLTNLLGNAFKFTAPNPSARIEFASRQTDGEAVFFVRDNGVGFDLAYAAKIFSPFQRFHHPNDFPGSGIGLATVQRIVQRHAGRVWAESAPGQGATFYFTIGEAYEPPI